MPFTRPSQAPEWVKGEKARRGWMEAFNSAWEQHHDESKAHAIAASVAKRVMSETNGRKRPERTMDIFVAPGLIEPENCFGKTVWKEILKPGRWFHPVAEQWREFTKDYIAGIYKAAKLSLGIGNLIPTPDGHTLSDSSRNKGYATDFDFDPETGSLRAKIDVADEEFAPKVGTTVRQMSVGLTGKTKLQDGTEVEDCIDHVAFTNVGVLTGLGDFVAAYARHGEAEKKLTAFRVYVPENDFTRTEGAGEARKETTTMATATADPPAPAAGATPAPAAAPETKNINELARLREEFAVDRKAHVEELARTRLEMDRLRQEADSNLFDRVIGEKKIPPAIADSLRPIFLARVSEPKWFSKDGKDEAVDLRAQVTKVLEAVAGSGVADLLSRKAKEQTPAEGAVEKAAALKIAQAKAADQFDRYKRDGKAVEWANEQRTSYRLTLKDGRCRTFGVPVESGE